MSVMVICAVLVAAFLVTALKGAPWAFIGVFIPALIMLNQLPEIANSARAAEHTSRRVVWNFIRPAASDRLAAIQDLLGGYYLYPFAVFGRDHRLVDRSI